MALSAGAREGAVVTDPLTGVAIRGYDPVAYFTEGEPVRGEAGHALVWEGVSWYFASAANRDVFSEAGAVYGPRWGGYCAMALARGHLSDGNPMIFAIHEGRLHLFYSLGNREAFLADPVAASAAAEAHWALLAPRPVQRLEMPGAQSGVVPAGLGGQNGAQ